MLRERKTLRVPAVKEELQVDQEPRVAREAVIRAQPHTELEEREVELHRQVLEVDEKGDANLPDAWEWTERRY